LLGHQEQLAGLSWIRDAIVKDGDLSIGQLVSENSKAQEPSIVLADTKRLERNFTQYRSVCKHKKGDFKAMWLDHPFDVWLQEEPSNIDVPLCWTAMLDREGVEDGIHVENPCHVLFDIGEVAKTNHILAWPKE
jgi:hypothetical protein